MAITTFIKRNLSNLVAQFGYEVKQRQYVAPGNAGRPVGNMQLTLQDLKARGLKCSNIIDVGANHGHWSMMARDIFPSAAFTLIEPQDEMKAGLEQFCRATPGSLYIKAGAGAADEKKWLTVWDDLAGSSFLPNVNQASQAQGAQREIQIITLDSLITEKKTERPELVKIDVQGFELQVLTGAGSLFGHTEVFIIETSLFPFEDLPGIPLAADVISFMHDKGYEIYDFAGFLRRPLDGALGQCDICFVKRDSFLRKINRWA